MDTRDFLTDKDQLTYFERDRERFARQIRTRQQKNAARQPLVSTVVDLARAYADERNHGFQGVGIAVEGGDGMTWSAHSVDRGLDDALPDVPRIRLQGQPGVYGPELAHVISMRKIAMAAQRHGLIKSVRLIGWRLTTLAIVGALAVGIAGALLSAVATASRTSSSITLRLVIFSAITVTLAMIGKYVSQLIYPNFRENTLAKVIDDLNALEKGPVTDQYREFIEEMSALLGRAAEFRCVIVDDFGVLDRTTRMVLDSYLRRQADDQRSELWVIFYSAADKSLEVEIDRPMRNKPYGYRRIKLFQQEPLTESQRRQLAEAYGVPQRTTFRTVRAIAQDPSGLVYLDDLFGQAHRERRSPANGKRAADAFDLFYLLAVDASHGGNPWLYERDILANFSREKGLRSRLLYALLPGRTLSRAVLSVELKNMRIKFFPLAGEVAGESGQRRLRATAEAAEILEGTETTEGKWANFDLADPRLVHLFWVLYWSDAELTGLPDAFFVQEIVAHLLRSAIPAELDAETLGRNFPLSALAKELFEVAMQCLEACLRYCLLDDVPELLNRAKDLVEDASKEESRRRRRRLRRLAWQAYGLLGDESVLSVALDLAPVAPAAAPPDEQPVLLELFLDSMPDATPERRQSIRGELARTDGGRSVTSYAQARAGWLTASIQPFFCPGTTALSAAATKTHEVLPGMLGAAIDALYERRAQQGAQLRPHRRNAATVQDEWRTTDILDISLGVWALAAGTCRDWRVPDVDSGPDRHTALVETLSSCYVLADDLAIQRRMAEPDAASLDLVADCLAEDLLAVVFAAGLVLLVHWPEFNGRRAPGWSDVARIVIESGHSLGIRVPIGLEDEGASVAKSVIIDAERCMGVLAVLWRSVGFRQQASFMTIRRAQFVTLAVSRNPATAEQVIQLLSAEFDTEGHIGLLALFAAAEGALFSNQLSSQILLRCSATARDRNFGEQFVTEICYLTLHEAQMYQVGLGGSLEFLVGHRSGGRGTPDTRLDAVLAEVADGDFESDVLILINSMYAMAGHAIVESVRAALDRRKEKVEDAEAATKVEAHLRVFDLQRRQRAGEKIDIAAELDAWTEMRDQACYTTILDLLMEKAEKQQLDRIVSEALQILPVTDKYLNYTGYVFLAFRLLVRLMTGSRPTSSDDKQTAISALQNGVRTWEQALPADDNIRIYRLLTLCDPGNSTEYTRHQIQWEQIALELDETERLPRLVDQGRFFLLIWHYFTFFAYYGLQSEPPVDVSGLTEPELSQELARWRKNRNDIPDPIRPGSGVGTNSSAGNVSGAFLTRGYALFFPPAADAKQRQALDAELEEGRHQFDQKAEGAIEAFYRIMRSLPQLPQAVEHILARHQDLVLARIEGQGTDSRSVA
jgi:hypothetical protein